MTGQQLLSRGRRWPLALSVVAILMLLAVTASTMRSAAEPAQVTSKRPYFVDCTAGSDTRNGTSPSSAWKSLKAVSARTFGPDTVIRLRRGCAWDGGLVLRGSGAAGRPLVLSAYGAGDVGPLITNTRGGAFATAVEVAGRHVVVEHLRVSRARESGVRLMPTARDVVVRNVEATAVGIGFMIGGRHNRVTGSSAKQLGMVVNTPRSVNPDDDYGAVGFWVSGPDNEIAESSCVDCRARSYDYGWDGGFLELYGTTDRTYVHDNYAHATEGYIEVGGTSGSARDVVVTDNVIDNVHGGVCLHNGDGRRGVSIERFRFERNTYVKTVSGGHLVFDCLGTVSPNTLTVRDNTFLSNIGIAKSGNFVHTHNRYRMIEGAQVGFEPQRDEVLEPDD